jgi:hypothetical protein
MTRLVSALAGSALALAAGWFVIVETAGEANAAQKNFSSTRSVQTRSVQTRSIQTRSVQPRSFNRPPTRAHQTKSFTTSKQKFTTTKHKSIPTKQKITHTKSSKSVNVGKKHGPGITNKQGPNVGKQFGPNVGKGANIGKGPNAINKMGAANLGKGPNIGKGPNVGKGPKVVKGPNVGKGPNVTFINKKSVTIVKGPKKIWWNGRYRTLVALGLLGGIYVGSTYFIPDGYVAVAAPVCHGITAEGCSLAWRDVPTDDGGVIAQCVQFCPQQTVGIAPAVVRPVAAAAPQAAVIQGCALTIHAEPNFAGLNSEVTGDQPQLSEAGWDKAISSIQIKSGTWDFYTEDNFGGQMIRLSPGQYPTLAQDWDKQINSMMCAQP